MRIQFMPSPWLLLLTAPGLLLAILFVYSAAREWLNGRKIPKEAKFLSEHLPYPGSRDEPLIDDDSLQKLETLRQRLAAYVEEHGRGNLTGEYLDQIERVLAYRSRESLFRLHGLRFQVLRTFR